MKINSSEILTPDAVQFLNKLHFEFDLNRRNLLEKRRTRLREIQSAGTLQFTKNTTAIDENWTVAPAPQDLLDRRTEITGPAESKMMINALNSGAKVFMADLEDALSPTWKNILEGQKALYSAVRRELQFRGENDKLYQLNTETATLVVRPRGLHLNEIHFEVDDIPISASLFDFGLYFFHNAKELLRRGSGPYFYLAKLESGEEAAWWNSVFIFAQDVSGIPRGTIRATVLIETITAAFEMDQILYRLREHAAGLNAGRWDYIFSLIKKFSFDPKKILPDRSQITMTTHFMNSYSELLVNTCHRRNAHAIGGMSAFIPNRRDPKTTEIALQKVRADKKREANMGFDGSWVAHPDLIPVAQSEFDQVLKLKPNQKSVIRDTKTTSEDLLNTEIRDSFVSDDGVRTNISVALIYIDRWLAGQGAVAIHNLMEDAATAEISRSQLWQWRTHAAKTLDGQIINAAYLQRALAEEFSKVSPTLFHKDETLEILSSLIFSDEIPEFLTSIAYSTLNQIHDKGASNANYRSTQPSMAN